MFERREQERQGVENHSMDRTLKTGILVFGVLGALAGLFFMAMGPLISTPPVPGVVLAAALGYPLMLFLSAVVVLFSDRGALLLSLAALGCVAAVLAFMFLPIEETGIQTDEIIFMGIIAAPALGQTVLVGGMAGTKVLRRRA